MDERRRRAARSPAKRSSTAAASGRANSARCAGVNVPLYSAEHFYIVTKPIAGVTPDLPVIRDPDGFIYYKEEVGGLVMGGFEPVAKPWNVDRIPDGFEFQLLPEDWDQFEILMENAIHRTPCLETARDQDAAERPRELHARRQLHPRRSARARRLLRLRGLQFGRHRQRGRRGPADRRMDRRRRSAVRRLSDVDIRRFAPLHANRRHLADRTVESLGLHYAMRWPREELATVRPLRRSPLYDRLQAKGAVFGTQAQLGARQLFPAGRRAERRRTRSTRRRGCRACSTSSAPAARTSSCSTRRRSPNSC